MELIFANSVNHISVIYRMLYCTLEKGIEISEATCLYGERVVKTLISDLLGKRCNL